MNDGILGHDSAGVNIVFVFDYTITIGIGNIRLIERNFNIAHREDVVRTLRIGEVRQRAADDQHRDEHDCDRSHQNGFLFHK